MLQQWERETNITNVWVGGEGCVGNGADESCATSWNGAQIAMVPNRIPNWRKHGIRHVELSIAQLKFEDIKGAIALGIHEDQSRNFEMESPLMNPNDANNDRMMATRRIFLACDKFDNQYATKGIAKQTLKFCEHHLQPLEIIRKCLKGTPRFIKNLNG